MTVGLRRNLVSATVLASMFTLSVPVFAQAATHSSDVATHHAVKRHARHHRHGIPQHNGGDRDGDNNGARSDGDGNL